MTRARCPVNALLLIPNRSSGEGFSLNKDFAPVLRKVKGDLGVNPKAPKSDFAREAYAAFLIASRSNVTDVLIGKEAYEYIYPNGGRNKTNCDVVGLGRSGIVLGEGKGKNLMTSFRQLDDSACALSGRGAGGRVSSCLVVAREIPYIMCPPGITSVSEARGRWRSPDISPSREQLRAIEAAKQLDLNPAYDYLLFSEEANAGKLTGLGLAVSKSGDNFVYTNRMWINGELAQFWTPIRKLVLPGTGAPGVELEFVKDN
jgi:hypothetical protein